MRRWATVSACLFVVGIGPGCASGPDLTPGGEAVVEASEEVEIGLESAAALANERPAYRVLLRYNPSRCPCPGYEVYVYGEWQRVWLDGSPTALARLDGFRTSGEQRQMTIRGVLTDTVRLSERRVSYPVFEIE